MAVLPFRVLEVRGYPINEFAMAALVGLSLFRPSRGGARIPGSALLAGFALLALLLGSGIANDVDWARRMGHLAILAGLVWALGTGRVSLRSSAIGLITGLACTIGLALLGIGGDSYPGRLTGFFGDPNAGAYFIATLGVLGIFFSTDRSRIRLVLAIPILAGLVLTYSRTGLLASAFAVVWVLFGRRLGPATGAAVAAMLVWTVASIPDDLTTFGPFSNRSGSDALRARIIAQEQVQLADMPWFGSGPGTAKVEVRGLEFFFHNSYLATRQEGGWPALVLILLLLTIAFLRVGQTARRGDLVAAAAQAAIISIAAMSITLGEVLLDTPVGVAIGFALGHCLRVRTEEGSSAEPSFSRSQQP